MNKLFYLLMALMISQNVNAQSPTGVSASPTSICAGSPVSLSATCATGTVTWYNQTTGGTAIGTGSPFTQNPTSTITYYASCKDGANESSRVATSAVTVTAQPTAPTGTSNPTICSNTTASLSATCATGNVAWYGSNSTTLLFTGSPFVTPNLSSNTTYNVRCESVSCQSGFVDVNVSINAVSDPTGTADATICNNATVSLSATCATGYVVWYDAITGGNIASTANPFITPQLTNTTRYYPECQNVIVNTPQQQTFNFTGTQQTFVVPAGVTSINIQAWGASGNSNALGVLGGKGGYAEGTLAVTPGSTLYIYVGGGGTISATGGYNGGGNAGTSDCTNAMAGGGGGASDIRVNGNALTDRVIIAAGGGGAAGNRVAGCGRGTGGGGGGGYYGGGGGAAFPGTSVTVATGGSQISGGTGGTSTYAIQNNGLAGSFGIGGDGGNEVSSSQAGNHSGASGGAGGGLTGNNGAHTFNFSGQSGAGGSSFLGSLTSVLTNADINTGNGQIIISYQVTSICSSNRVEVVVSINNVTSPTGMSNPTICGNTTASLSATCASGNVAWYGSNSTTLLSTVSPFVTPNLTANTTYNVRCESGSCNSNFVSVTASVVGGGSSPTLSQTPQTNVQPLFDEDGNPLSSSKAKTYTLTPLSTVQTTNAPATLQSCTTDFFDGFETGCYLPNWTLSNSSVQTFDVLNSASVQGTYHLQGVGGNSTHLTGLSTTIPSSTPTEISWYIYPQGSGGSNYVVIGDNSVGTQNCMVFQFCQGGNSIRFVSSYTLAIPATPNAWYFVELKNINYTSRTFDIYVNNVLRATAFPFRSTSLNNISKIHLYNFDNSTAKWDNIKLGPNPPTVPTGTSNPTICNNSTTSLSATCATGNVAWYGSNSTTLLSTGSPFVTPNLTANTTYIVRCESGSCSSGFVAVNVTIENPPNAQITGGGQITCSNPLISLTATGGGTYAWSNGLGTNASVTVSQSGTYTVTVTSANGCTSTATVNITQNSSVPTAGINGGGQITCSNPSISLTATGGGSYSWSNGLGTNASVTVSQSGIYTVTVTSANGCTATATVNITSNTTPPTAGINGGGQITCSNPSISLTATGGGTYSWSNGLGTNVSVTVSQSGIYTVTVTSANGCTATATVNITQDNSVPTAGISGGGQITCSNPSISLTGTGGGTYSWSNGLGTNASVTVSQSGIYIVTVTSANGCTATATVNITSNTTPPTAGINGGGQITCSNPSISLTATGGGTYSWSNGLGTNVSVTVSQSGTYTVTVTNANGCTATATTTVTTDLTVPNAQITGSNNLSCAVTSVTRTASGGGTYSWSNGLGINAQATISRAGTYTVTVTSANGCTATASTVVIFTNDLIATASNTGPYQIGNTIQLSSTGGNSYSWNGPNGFTSAIANPTIINALQINNGIYTVTVSTGICSATATTNVIVSGIDPCTQIMEYTYVEAGNPFTPLFNLTNGMNIAQNANPTSILVRPICPSITIESVDMTLAGPVNYSILQNVEPNALFDNFGNNVYGQVLPAGTYTLTITGYAQDNRNGGITYGPVVTTFTIVGNMPTVSMPNFTGNEFCAGSNATVSFSTTGSFAVGNKFQVLLSDVHGSFNNPVIIGTSTNDGNVLCTIPANTLAGAYYRLKIAATDPAISGVFNPTNITIHPANLNLISPTDDFSSGNSTKKASETIAATNKLNSPASVIYQAGKAIVLNAGFEAKAGTLFTAKIVGCN